MENEDLSGTALDNSPPTGVSIQPQHSPLHAAQKGEVP